MGNLLCALSMKEPSRWLALIGVSLLAFTAFLDVTIVDTAIPFIQKALPSSILQLQWVLNIFTIVLSTTMIGAGKFSDLFGRKKIFFIGAFIFGIAALGAGFSESISVLIFFRGLQGLGASLLFISSMALLTDIFPKEEHSKAVGIYTAITGTGLTIGPAVGGILIGLLNWRWVFWINVPIVLVGLTLSAITLSKAKKSATHEVHIDWKGLFLLIVGLASFTYGIISVAQRGWDHLFTLLMLAVGIGGLFLLFQAEKKSHHPLLDLEIFKNKTVLLSVISSMVAGIVSFVYMFFDPLYLKTIRELSPYAIGLLITAIPAAQIVVSIFFASLLKKFGLRTLLTVSVGSAFLASLIHCFIGPNFPLVLLIVPFFLLGINWGLSNTCQISSVHQEISEHRAGRAIGTITTMWNVVGGIVLAIASALFHSVQLRAFLDHLKESNLKIGPQRLQAVTEMLQNGSGTVQTLHSEALFSLFQESFMSAYGWVMGANALLILIAFAAVLMIRAKRAL